MKSNFILQCLALIERQKFFSTSREPHTKPIEANQAILEPSNVSRSMKSSLVLSN
jgi:hypothetical protein